MLVSAMIDIEELNLRTRQAMVRSAKVQDVLDPAITRLSILRESLRTIQAEILAAWCEGQDGDTHVHSGK